VTMVTTREASQALSPDKCKYQYLLHIHYLEGRRVEVVTVVTLGR
jgi:hypothetical protein